MVPEVFIIGGGGAGASAVSIALQLQARQDIELVGIFDDNAACRDDVEQVGVRYLGEINNCLDLPRTARYCLALTAAAFKKRTDDWLTREGFAAISLIDPHVHIGPAASLGDGTIIEWGSAISARARIGRGVFIGKNVMIGHDVELSDYSAVYMSAALAGYARVGEGAIIGTSSTVNQHVEIGEHATVGANAAVVRPVAAGVVVGGVPARPLH